MRKLFGAFVSIMILANQATTLVPNSVADSVQAPAKTEGIYTLKLNTNKVAAIEVKSTSGSFNQVKEHLINEQNAKAEADAKKAEEAKQAAIRKQQAAAAVVQNPVVKVSTGDVWEQLRMCEAGGNYARNSGNGYYGAYQFDIGTWGGYGGYARADLAPPAVQDEKARLTHNARGWYPWPACARKLGLI